MSILVTIPKTLLLSNFKYPGAIKLSGYRKKVMKALKTVSAFLKKAARPVVQAVDRLAHSPLAVAVVGFVTAGVAAAVAQGTGTDATTIASNAYAAFGTIAPITITIAGFYVILHLAKRVVS